MPTCNGSSVGILVTPDSLGVFDSHSRDKHGKQTANGTACYVSKSSVKNLCYILFENLGANRSNVEAYDYNNYKLTYFTVKIEDAAKIPEILRLWREEEEIYSENLLISNEPLNEGVQNEAVLSNYRNIIMDLPYFLGDLQKFYQTHDKTNSCRFTELRIVKQYENCYKVTTTFTCAMCGFSCKIRNVRMVKMFYILTLLRS